MLLNLISFKKFFARERFAGSTGHPFRSNIEICLDGNEKGFGIAVKTIVLIPSAPEQQRPTLEPLSNS